MNHYCKLIGLALSLPLVYCAQAQEPISIKSEPHHHLVLQNKYVNVYSVQVPPHDAVQLHRHEVNAIGITINDALITVKSPGKPDARQNVGSGQMRLQPAGYVHSTSVEGDVPFRNVTVELLLPQQKIHNVCVVVAAGQPLDCPDHASEAAGAVPVEVPAFQTDQTSISTIRLAPRQSVTLGTSGSPGLVIALDEGSSTGTGSSSATRLRKGEFSWRDVNTVPQAFTNDSAGDVRLIAFTFKPE
jgi:hypothetical protein